VQQYRDLAIVRFSGVAPQPAFTHAWFPVPDFDLTQITGDTAIARAGRAHLMLRGSGPLVMVGSGPTAGHELRLAGRDGWWLVRLGSVAQHGDGFAGHFAGLRPQEDAGTIRIADPDYGEVVFRPDGSVEAEQRRIAPEEMTVSGAREVLPRGPLR
jgi:hypothetical protein